jgi:hypothetical protein
MDSSWWLRNMGFSWWLRDSAGNWHVAAAGERHVLSPGKAAFPLRLTPPLATRPGTLEVIVTGSSGQVRVIVPIHDGHQEESADHP